MKAGNFEGDLNGFLREYHYQPDLTKKLDGYFGDFFSQGLINEIVLWKLNRYVSLDDAALRCLEGLRSLKTGEHRRGEHVLRSLLGSHGADLPMASTILRFRNANAFQIIDRHAYRAVYDQDYRLYPASSNDRKVAVYFDYLDQLVELSQNKGLAFETIDRLLYIFDKRKNGTLSRSRNLG